ncbi:DUF3987 domain-containing protein [Sphingomonas sp. M1-B02]|uniref:DUF3987 domain-containing protein n=1 Tax=Sphingomonas sp. M1-B02 TaxID=3114300 RepID=UPI00223F43F8|nr:DUF3987 domain-containing protein [Sphingomonas sp. S6-11]UZK64640.1 YfjI family protein [Sphingomonas sp. S6-11]
MSVLVGGRTAPVSMSRAVFGDLWPLVADLAEGTGAPVDYVGCSLLAVAASLIGSKRRVQPFESAPLWRDPPVLWIALVGDPSSNKSPAIDAVVAPLRAIELEYAEAHKLELVAHQAVAERAKAERNRWQEAVKAATRDGSSTPSIPAAAELPDDPVRRRLLVQDATPESMCELLASNPNGMLHMRDELSGWLSSFERYSPGGRDFWLEAYLLGIATVRFDHGLAFHRQWELARAWVRASFNARDLAAVMVHHVPALAARAHKPHIHVLYPVRTLAGTFGPFVHLTRAMLAAEWEALLTEMNRDG